jgi:hypothetical protein
MSTIITQVNADTTVENFFDQAAKGTVKFYRERGNGTTRHIAFLADGTTDREVAEWAADQREQGVTMRTLSREMHLSVPTIRRMLNALLLTEEVEEYEAEDIADLLALVQEPAPLAQPEPAAAETEAPLAQNAEQPVVVAQPEATVAEATAAN